MGEEAQTLQVHLEVSTELHLRWLVPPVSRVHSLGSRPIREREERERERETERAKEIWGGGGRERGMQVLIDNRFYYVNLTNPPAVFFKVCFTDL